MKKNKLIILLSSILILLTISSAFLYFFITRTKDFNKSNYKHIRLKSSWEKIYCDVNSHIVCAKTKDGYMEVYDADLKYLKKIKLPEYKKIKIYDFNIVIVKQDGTVWSCDAKSDKGFIKLDGMSDVVDIYLSYCYSVFKNSKGDFYYIQNDKNIERSRLITTNDFKDTKTPQLIKNLHNAEIINFDLFSFVYTKDGNTYIHINYHHVDYLSLFDKDNNVTYDKCIDGIKYKKAFQYFSRINLYDSKNRIGRIYKIDDGIIQTLGPVDTKIKIDKITSMDNSENLYALNKKGKLYEVAVYSFDDETPDISNPKVSKDRLFKYKKFKNIYGGFYLYATDDKYLYLIDNDKMY